MKQTNHLDQIKGINAIVAAINMAETKKAPTSKPDPGIYVLFNNGESVYIGMSMSGESRIDQHLSSGKKVFDSYKYISLPGFTKQEILAIECVLISLYSPMYNSQCNLDKKYAVMACAIKKLSKK